MISYLILIIKICTILLAVSLEPENADYSNNRQMLLRESGNYLNAISDAKRSVYLAKVFKLNQYFFK